MEHVQNKHPPTDPRKLPPLKIALYVGFAVGAIVLVCILTLLLFPGSLVNRFIKPRITEAFAEAYPAYSIHIADMKYSVFKNRFGFDSLALSAVDGTFSSNMGPFSVSGIGWMHLLWGGSLAPHDFANSVVDAKDIVLDFPQEQYELRCGRLRVSVPDSEIVAEAIRLHPLGDDEQFFAGSKFRKTRFRFVVPHARVMGLACLELLQGKMYRTRSAQVRDAFIDVLINKDKPTARDTLSPPMPNEILALMGKNIEVDSLTIWNGGLKYGERYTAGSEPGVITLDSMQVSVRGIDSRGDAGDTVVIRAKGEFMRSAEVNLLMSIPIPSPEFSLQYSGSLSRMDLNALNLFVEPAEQVRIKSGSLQAASFDITVTAGHASGSVRAAYKDLSLAAINQRTGSEKGMFDVIASFLANNVKLRTSNMPDKSGAMKIGKVKHTRLPDDTFFRFAWVALRSGLADVVGF
jgi:hypothetical protein